jgi:HAD superfamily hydrolase (TIGR01549 family)
VSVSRPVGVLFDAAGTLLDLDPPLAERAMATAGCTLTATAREEFARALSSRRDWPVDSDGPADRQRRWTAFCAIALAQLLSTGTASLDGAGLASAAADLAQQVLDVRNYRVYDDTLPCLDALAAGGVPVGLVSNFDRWLVDVLDACGIGARFGCIVLSSQEGCEKPDSRLFTIAAGRLGLPPRELLYVGDSPRADVGGALGAGMHAALIDRAERFPPRAFNRVTSLVEVPPMVG